MLILFYFYSDKNNTISVVSCAHADSDTKMQITTNHKLFFLYDRLHIKNMSNNMYSKTFCICTMKTVSDITGLYSFILPT